MASPSTPPLTKPIFLIQMGNFLEFFDIFLSIHMTMVLNMVFFSHSSPLFSAFIFCLSFTLRPIGAFVFGYLGDIWGRKRIIVLTTITTGLASLGIALLPSYHSIGAISSLMFVIFRMLQGISSVGEAAGCCVYIAEIIPPPKVHFHMTLTDFFGDIGSLVALLISSAVLFMDPVNGWRFAFFFGAITAILGGFSRKYLIETPEFETTTLQKDQYSQQLIPKISDLKNLISYFMVVVCP